MKEKAKKVFDELEKMISELSEEDLMDIVVELSNSKKKAKKDKLTEKDIFMYSVSSLLNIYKYCILNNVRDEEFMTSVFLLVDMLAYLYGDTNDFLLKSTFGARETKGKFEFVVKGKKKSYSNTEELYEIYKEIS
jgi:hypothetical protein